MTAASGFGFKWNMGWMNDTLDYMAHDPVHRRWHHDKLTFGLLYAFSENFVLPLSHDEVVHGKGSILGRMPGDDWQRCATLRAYYAFMWALSRQEAAVHGPGIRPASASGTSPPGWTGTCWITPSHRGMQTCVRDLNRLYRAIPALHARDCEGGGFQLDRRRRRRPVGLRLAAAGGAGRTAGRGHLQLHPGAAAQLPPGPAACRASGGRS